MAPNKPLSRSASSFPSSWGVHRILPIMDLSVVFTHISSLYEYIRMDGGEGFIYFYASGKPISPIMHGGELI
jgi:hypothetical protein